MEQDCEYRIVVSFVAQNAATADAMKNEIGSHLGDVAHRLHECHDGPNVDPVTSYVVSLLEQPPTVRDLTNVVQLTDHLPGHNGCS